MHNSMSQKAVASSYHKITSCIINLIFIPGHILCGARARVYIYIYMCVCVCVCVCNLHRNTRKKSITNESRSE